MQPEAGDGSSSKQKGTSYLDLRGGRGTANSKQSGRVVLTGLGEEAAELQTGHKRTGHFQGFVSSLLLPSQRPIRLAASNTTDLLP